MEKLLSLILLMLSLDVYSQWELVNGPYHSSDNISMSFDFLSEDKGVIAAISDVYGYSDRVLISPNNGKSWLQTDAINEEYPPRCVDIKDSIVIVGTLWGGVFVSDNYGTSFKQISDGLPESQSIFYIVITDSSYVATSSSSFSSGYDMYYLPTGSEEWIEAEGFSSFWPTPGVNKLFVDGDRVYASTSTGLYVSNDFGATWEETGMTEGIGNALAIDNRIFVSGATTGDELQFSDDYGESWVVNTSNYPSPFVGSFAYNDDKVFATSGYNAVYSTANNGGYWSLSNSGLDCGYVGEIFAYGDTAVVICSSNGPGYSYNGGSSWSNWSKTYGQEVRSFTVSGEYLIAATDYKVHTSNDLGNNWSSFNNTYKVVHALDSVVLAGNSFGLRYSYDNGLTFSGSSPPGLPYPSSIEVINSKDSVVILFSGDHGLFYSADTAQSFENRTGILEGQYVNDIFFVDSTVFAATSGLGLFVSHDYGLNWQFSSADIPDTTIQVVRAMGNDLLAGTGHKGLFISDDSGESWSALEVGDASRDTCVLAVFVDGCQIYASFKGRGVYKSEDCGDSWSFFNQGLINRNVSVFEYFNGYLFAGTNGASVWRTPIEVLNTSLNDNADSSKEKMITVFPNPVDNVLTLKSSKNEMASFDILDSHGRVLTSESGMTGEKQMDASFLPNGLYLIRVATDDWVETHKFVKK